MHSHPLFSSIQDLLHSYKPKTTKQQTYKEKFLQASLESCHRDFLNPGHFTASGFVCTPNYSHAVLIFHPRFQKWIQPGGHLEASDSDIISAAQREVQEESGLCNLSFSGQLLLDVHHVPTTPKQTAHEHWDIQMLFLHPKTPLAGELRAQWVQKAHAHTLQTDQSVLQFLAQLP